MITLKNVFFFKFSIFFTSSRSIPDLQIIVAQRIARAFNISGATGPFGGIRHACHLYKLRFYGTSGLIFRIFTSIFSNRLLRVVLYGTSSQ